MGNKRTKINKWLPRGVVVPDHVAIIPDGNRRWARARGKHTFFGHKRGFDLVPEIVRAGREMGIHTMTLWAFSTENWDRSKEEIAYLMEMYEGMIEKNLREAHKHEAKIVHLGRKDRIPASLANKIAKAEAETRDYARHVLNVALDYGGHDEIIRAVGRIVSRITNHKSQVTGELRKEIGKYRGKYPIYKFADYLDTAGQAYPYVDLVVRTSGEQRTSGLLSWQTAYAEFYFASEHFPDFSGVKLAEAVVEYSRRRRRFGGGDKAKHLKFDSKKAGKWEMEWWRSRREGREGAERYLVKLTEEVYGLKNGLASEGVAYLVRGMEREGEAAVREVERFFELMRQETGFAYDARRAAELEVRWWKVSREGEGLEGVLREALAEQFRVNRLQVAKAARLKMLAMGVLDEEDWGRCEDYLVRSWRALKEMVA